jgi:hypothetical protein
MFICIFFGRGGAFSFGGGGGVSRCGRAGCRGGGGTLRCILGNRGFGCGGGGGRLICACATENVVTVSAVINNALIVFIIIVIVGCDD